MPAFRHLNLTENQQTGNMKKKILPNLEIKQNTSKYTLFKGKISIKTNKQKLKQMKRKAHNKISTIKCSCQYMCIEKEESSITILGI